ncbi:MAG: hypothetical protein WBA23_11075 [Tunicatimonas sp.]|uniref:hypothetical protein n=1 Tax=Tunicatimonas sp. TaxID=1940096 RepID=UPI003C72D88D
MLIVCLFTSKPGYITIDNYALGRGTYYLRNNGLQVFVGLKPSVSLLLSPAMCVSDKKAQCTSSESEVA